MKKFILLLAVATALIGIIGFSIDFAATSFLRVLFLVTADILVIVLLGRLFFQTENGKLKRRKVIAR